MITFDTIPEALEYILGDDTIVDKVYHGHREFSLTPGITNIDIMGTRIALYKAGGKIFLDEYLAKQYIDDECEEIVDELY